MECALDCVRARFVFGPAGAYFFELEDERKWRNLPAELEAIVGKKETYTDHRGVARGKWENNIYRLQFSDDGGFFVIYEDVDNNQGPIFASQGGPQDLKNWIEVNFTNRKLEDVIFVLGTNNSFFAYGMKDGGYIYYWNVIPEGVLNILQRNSHVLSDPAKRTSLDLALGPGNSHFACFQQYPQYPSPVEFSVEGVPPALTDILGRLKPDETTDNYIVLNPYADGEFFAMLNDHDADWPTIAWQVDAVIDPDVKRMTEQYRDNNNEEDFDDSDDGVYDDYNCTETHNMEEDY